MSTQLEQKRQAEILLAKYQAKGIRTKWYQNGFKDCQDGTTAIQNHHPEFSRTKCKGLAKAGRVKEFTNGNSTISVDPVDLMHDDTIELSEPHPPGRFNTVSLSSDGWVPREGQSDQDPNNQSDDITQAKNYVQQHVDDVDDPELGEAWKNVLAALNTLTKQSNDTVPKAVVNRSADGTTEPAHHVASDGRNVQPKTVDISSLKTDSAKIMYLDMAARFPGHFSLK